VTLTADAELRTDDAAPALDPDIRRTMQGFSSRFFYGFGSIAFGVKDQGFATFLLFFYNQVYGAAAGVVGQAIALALMIDAFADPLIGQMSDNLRSRWGRRHPFMYAAALPIAIAYYFLWNPPKLEGTNLFLYLFGVIVVVRTFISVYEIPSSALLPELTPDYDKRTSFLAYRFLFGWIGGHGMTLLAFGVFLKATAQYPLGQLNPAGYVGYSTVACIIIVVAILVTADGTHRFIPYLGQPPARRLSFLGFFKEMFQTLRNRSFAVITVAALFATIAGGTLTALGTYFGTFLWGLGAKQIFFMNLLLIAAPVGAFFIAPFLTRRLGKKTAAITLWVASTLFYWTPMAARLLDLFPRNGDPALLPLLIFFQTTGTMLSVAVQITISSMLADVIEESQIQTGRRSEGLLFSANAFVLKATSGMGAWVATLLLASVRFPTHANPATIDPHIARHLALNFFPVTFILYAVALGCLSFYRINRRAHEENLRAIGAGAG
jgi:glycoside/pentoside/hexuronide:cation symporter, GPH family